MTEEFKKQVDENALIMQQIEQYLLAQEAKIDVKRMPAHSYRQVHEYQQQQSFSQTGHQAAAQTTSKKPKLKSSPAREILS